MGPPSTIGAVSQAYYGMKGDNTVIGIHRVLELLEV